METMRYKPSDKVRIKSIDWYNENKDEYGYIDCGSRSFFTKMSNWCGKIATIKEICKTNCYRLEEYDFDWTDEMIEGLVEEEAKPEPKFKVGDRVITDTNMKGKIIEVVEEGWYRVEFEPCNGIPQPNGVVPEESMSLVEEETLIKLTGEAIKNNEMVVSIDEWILPEGYIFKDENGNVINAKKIVLEKKKKEYPKTYEECYKIMGVKLSDCYIQGYKSPLLEDLQELLICRDAYWKIAGDEMGLGKPWEPDWKNSEERRYCIVNIEGDINLPEKVLTKWILKVTNKILVFPTEEMRDAFYENFKELIKMCKELL